MFHIGAVEVRVIVGLLGGRESWGASRATGLNEALLLVKEGRWRESGWQRRSAGPIKKVREDLGLNVGNDDEVGCLLGDRGEVLDRRGLGNSLLYDVSGRSGDRS